MNNLLPKRKIEVLFKILGDDSADKKETGERKGKKNTGLSGARIFRLLRCPRIEELIPKKNVGLFQYIPSTFLSL